MADFVLGRLKFHFKGSWTTSTAYIKDDVVTYGGNSFVCLVNHTAAADFYTDLNHATAKWQLMVGGIAYRGNWTASTLYRVDDIVTYGGSTYRCNTGHTGQADLYDDETKWTKFTPGFKYRGNHVSGMDLRNDDIVKYGANLWITTVHHTTTSDIMNEQCFELFVEGLQFEDSWGSSSYYQAGDIVTYGGYQYVAERTNNNVVPYNNSADWKLLSTGFTNKGTWSSATAYRTGDAVNHGGHYYVAKIDGTNQEPTGTTDTYWDLVVEGIFWRSNWASGTAYKIGDAVSYGSSSYRSLTNHTASASNRPDVSGQTDWSLLAEGDSNATLTTRGDILTRDATQRVRLPIGSAGQFLKSDGTDLQWAYPNVGNKVYYVSTLGTDNTDTGRGSSPELPWRTIKYACTQLASDTTNFKTIKVETGTYTEQLPIKVPRKTAIIGDNLRSVTVSPDTTTDNGAGAGISSDNSTPNNRQTMFYLNDSCTLSGMTFSGMTGQLASSASADGLTRLTEGTGSNASGSVVALDPGTGPSDTSVHIVSRSPFVQNCSSIGTRAVGIKIDGTLHNAGFKSILANDFTQVLDGGIGCWAKGGSKSELVSVFTYYCHVGYLADSGSVIRSLNSNNSYGEKGSVASGVDANETPLSTTVTTRDNEAVIGRALVSNAGVYRLEQEYAGESYTSATETITGSGANANFTADFADGAVKYIDTTTNGAGHFTTVGVAQGGTTTTIKLAASDTQANNFYNGMRITITDGTGSGQTGYVGTYTAATKTATMFKEDGSAGFDVFGPTSVAVAPNATSSYEIEPRVTISGGGSPTRNALARVVIENQQIKKFLIIDGGAGYSSAPSVTVTDPNATTLGTGTASIGNGVISRWTYVAAGSGYKQENTAGTISGDGFADILPVGATVKTSGLSSTPKAGSSIVFSNASSVSYIIVTVLSHTNGGITNLEVSPNITKANAPTHGTTATIRENYSNIRLTGHDFLDIGTGGIATTNYPDLNGYTQQPDQADEVDDLDRGRVFYTSTDQDGNFRVGELFRVEQSTGKATLNAEAFDLSGLRQLSLGSVALGNFGATISEFSTDGTLGDNSDSALVTEKAIRTFVETQLGGGNNNLTVNSAVIGELTISGSNISASAGNTVNFTTIPTTSIAPTASTHLVNKNYVDENITPNLQTLSFDRDTGAVNRKVVTNFNATTQYEDTLYNAAEQNIGFEIINGTMKIEIDKAGNLVYRTTGDTESASETPSNQ
jgi:hypothetical protein